MKIKVNETVEKEIQFPYYYKIVPQFQLNSQRHEQYVMVDTDKVITVSVDENHKPSGAVDTAYTVSRRENSNAKMNGNVFYSDDFTDWIAKNIRLTEDSKSNKSEFLWMLNQAIAFAKHQYDELDN